MADTVMLELVKALRRAPQQRLEKMLREHLAGSDGHCRPCHTIGPCTLYVAALAARHPNGTL